MRKSDSLFWLGMAGILFYVYQRSKVPGTVPEMPWTWTGAGFDPNYIPPPPTGARNVAIANRTQQPALQGGTRSPSVINTQVEQSAAGNPYAGVPFIY